LFFTLPTQQYNKKNRAGTTIIIGWIGNTKGNLKKTQNQSKTSENPVGEFLNKLTQEI
jgi:hypothetical protein